MKYRNMLSGLMATVLIFSSCEEAEIGLSDEVAIKRVMDRIEDNQGLALGLFDVLGEHIHTDSLKRLLAGAKTDAEFVDLFASQTTDYFSEVVEFYQADLLIPAIPMPFAGEAEITLKNLLCEEGTAGAAPFDPVQAYSDLVLKRLKEQAADNDHKDWILLESFQASDSEPRPLPSEEISMNYTKIEMMATVPHTVILNLELSDEEVLETLNDILSTHDIPPVAIGLLLPAVQKVREAASTANQTPFDQGLLTWLDETVEPAIGGGLDRDIIRRIQATVFLAGLNTILLPEYQNKNQDLASLSILHAQYRAALICTSRETWNKK